MLNFLCFFVLFNAVKTDTKYGKMFYYLTYQDKKITSGGVTFFAWPAWHGIWYVLVGLAWYMVCPGGPGMVYGIAWRGMGWYMVWPGGMTCIWYGLSGMALYMVWYSGYGMIYGVTWRAWHDKWYGLVGVGWYMVLPGEYRMVDGVAWRDDMYMVWSVGHDIVYRMAWRDMARYMVWPCGHGMVNGMIWRCSAWYRIWPAGHGMAYGMA